MIIPRISNNEAQANKVYLVCRNDEASAAWVAGGAITLQSDGTEDGFAAIKLATAAKASLLIGVADQATTAGNVGWVQCYGVRTDTVINQAGTASNANGAIGDVLIPWTASGAFSGVAAGAATGYSPWAVLMATVASSTAVTTTTGTVFLRCM
jgi:hypothetical protein